MARYSSGHMDQNNSQVLHFEVSEFYQADINNHPILTPEQEQLLIEELKLGRVRATAALEKLILANLRRVIDIAKYYVHPQFPFHDAIGAGNLGLVHGAQKFDPFRGAAFGTYVTWWIRQEISREYITQIRWGVTTPEKIGRKLSQVRNLHRKYEAEKGRKPTFQEFIRELKLSEKEVKTLLAIPSVVSFDAETGTDEKTQDLESRAALWGDTTDPADIVTDESDDMVLKLLKHIPERRAKALYYRWDLDGNYGEDRPYHDIATLLGGMSLQRAKQLTDSGNQLLKEYILSLSPEDRDYVFN